VTRKPSRNGSAKSFRPLPDKPRQRVPRLSYGTSPAFALTQCVARLGVFADTHRWCSVPGGQRQSISAASAVNANGAFWYCTYEGGLNGESFVELLQRMMKYRRKPIHLVLDGLPAHKTALVKNYVASTEGRLTGPPDLALFARLCPGFESRRIGIESCQAHRYGKASVAKG